MYKQKYIKYKTKYLGLKMNQKGGGIFDLNDQYYFGENVQENILFLHEKFGEKFIIKKNTISVPIELQQIKIVSNDLTFYELRYDKPDRTYIQSPFAIWFIDMKTMELNNNTYINYIHSTEQYTGSDMVRIVLDIQRKLNVQKTVIHDATTIMCSSNKEEYNLSFFKLLEQGKTYYMRFGFDVEFLDHYGCEMPFKNKSAWHNIINDLLANIKQIKIKDIVEQYKKIQLLINNVNEKQDYENFKVKYLTTPNILPYDYFYEGNIKSKNTRIRKRIQRNF